MRLTSRGAAALTALLALLPGPAGPVSPVSPVGAGSPARPGRTGAAGPTPATRAKVVLPFDAYRFSRSDRRKIDRATDLLIDDCMRSHGFDVTVPTADSGPPAVRPNSRRYGVIDPDVAALYGYHFPPDPGATRRAASYQAWYGRLPGRERDALDGGTGAGGCTARADRALRAGIVLTDPGWFTPLDFRSLDESVTDPGVRAATVRWRACMATHRMHYANPQAAISDPRWKLNSPTPSGAEIATATADVGCKHRVGLVRTWLAAEAELQRGLITRRASAFAALAAGNARYVANAYAVLAGHRPRRPRPRPGTSTANPGPAYRPRRR
ncbi:MAG TPA: hypothetical protein VFX70_04460 [Mycobacteriales bacterium]|nr:hypothetical protein [Mycobacteriales bacterium]